MFSGSTLKLICLNTQNGSIISTFNIQSSYQINTTPSFIFNASEEVIIIGAVNPANENSAVLWTLTIISSSSSWIEISNTLTPLSILNISGVDEVFYSTTLNSNGALIFQRIK